jgi:hypothetical protein
LLNELLLRTSPENPEIDILGIYEDRSSVLSRISKQVCCWFGLRICTVGKYPETLFARAALRDTGHVEWARGLILEVGGEGICEDAGCCCTVGGMWAKLAVCFRFVEVLPRLWLWKKF